MRLGKTARVDLSLQILNVFNSDAVEGWASRNLFPGQSLEAANWVAPRQGRITVKLSF